MWQDDVRNGTISLERLKKYEDKTIHDMSVFDVAVIHKQEYIIQYLKDKKLPICPLHIVCQEGRLDLVEFFLNIYDVNTYVDYQHSWKVSPIMLAIKFKHFDIVKTLLQAGANLNFRFSEDLPTFFIVAYSTLEIARFIMENYKINEEYFRVLHLACKSKNTEVFLYLAEYFPYRKLKNFPIECLKKCEPEIKYFVRKRIFNQEFSNLQKDFLYRKIIF